MSRTLHPALLAALSLVCALIVLVALPAEAQSQSRFFPETGHTVREPFLSFWQRGGVELFGYPLTEELTEQRPEDGRTYTVQYFERARLERDPASGRITLGLLGREVMAARGVEPVAPPEAAPQATSQIENSLPYEAARVVKLVNTERAAVGLPPLTVAPELTTAAAAYSAEMASSGLISHTGADGRGPAQRLLDAGYRWLRCGENLAVGQPTPEEAVAFWMGSPPHRANILDPQMREIGAGYVWQPGGYGHYWTITLGVR